MLKILYLSLACFVLINCGSTCEDVKSYSKSLVCNFKITGKESNKFLEFYGIDKNNNKIRFTISRFWRLYNFVEIGDSLIKKLGETEIILKKRDTTLIFPLMCRGQIVE